MRFNPEWLIEVVETAELTNWATSSLIVNAVTTLFARYAKKLVQATHSPLESDGMMGILII